MRKLLVKILKGVFTGIGFAITAVVSIGFSLAFQIFAWGFTILFFWYLLYWVGCVSTAPFIPYPISVS